MSSLLMAMRKKSLEWLVATAKDFATPLGAVWLLSLVSAFLLTFALLKHHGPIAEIARFKWSLASRLSSIEVFFCAHVVLMHRQWFRRRQAGVVHVAKLVAFYVLGGSVVSAPVVMLLMFVL